MAGLELKGVIQQRENIRQLVMRPPRQSLWTTPHSTPAAPTSITASQGASSGPTELGKM